MKRRQMLIMVGGLASSLGGCSRVAQNETPTESERHEAPTGMEQSPTPTKVVNATQNMRQSESRTPTKQIIPDTDWCDSVKLPRPTPTKEGLNPVSFPEYPTTLTARNAEKFSIDFEYAYRYNWFLEEEFISETDEMALTVGVADWALIEKEEYYIIGVESVLKTSDTNHPTDQTEAPSASYEFAAWYRLSPKNAYRMDIKESEFGRNKIPESFDEAMRLICHND